jgi:hypothetical protein
MSSQVYRMINFEAAYEAAGRREVVQLCGLEKVAGKSFQEAGDITEKLLSSGAS